MVGRLVGLWEKRSVHVEAVWLECWMVLLMVDHLDENLAQSLVVLMVLTSE
jgi:hypothetical protein